MAYILVYVNFFYYLCSGKGLYNSYDHISHSEKEAIMTYDEIMASIYDFKALTNRGK